MRERLGALGLALLLCAAPAWATEPVAVVAPPPVQPAPEAAETGEQDTEAVPAASAEETRDEKDPGPPGYMEVKGHAESVTEGGLRVSVVSGVPRSSRGYLPLEVVLQNEGPTPRLVRIVVEGQAGSRGGSTTRQLEVGPRQRVSAWLPVPVNARGGVVRVRSPGLDLRDFSFYSVEAGRAVMVLGTERAFDEGTRLPRVEERQEFAVRFVSPEDGPRELAAYVGHALVVVAGDVPSLPAETWTALEAYASTGGELVLLHPPRDVGQRLPLLNVSPTPGMHPYGFGKVRLCEAGEQCGRTLLTDAAATDGEAGQAVLPAGAAPAWQRRAVLNDDAQPLLPGVQAPVGRFLLLITLFVLAVGPGGLMLARRKGPVALLIAVPSVSLVTCLAIVVWSVLVEGFSLHAARQSFTWLDRERDRAVTVGVGGYYANLEPGELQLPALGALLPPDVAWDTLAVEADWTNGMRVTGGFLPARTYREWGEIAVVPTRARLSIRREDSGPWVQNALGAPLADGYLLWEGKVWKMPALADGEQGALLSADGLGPLAAVTQLMNPFESRHKRFGPGAWSGFGTELTEGHFIARLEGVGLGPVAALPVKLHEGMHLIRGRVDAP